MGKHKGRHKIKREEVAGVGIHEKRPGYWLVDVQINNKRVRKCFKSIEAAKVFAQAKQLEIENRGTEVLNFTDRLRTDALEADRLLQGSGATILDCVRDWLRRNPLTGGEALSVTCEKYLTAMRKSDRRPLAIYDKELKFKALCEAMGAVPTGAITDTELTQWAEVRGGSKVTQRAYLTVARAVVNFHKRGDRLKTRGTTDEAAPVTMDVKTVGRILAAAEKIAPDITAGLAILFFGGLRPFEMQRLQWSAIDLDANVIRLTGADTKTRTMRHVEIAPNLRAWLVRYRKTEGPVVPSQSRYRDQREAVMVAAKVSAWPVDVARHTFATALYASTNDAAKVMAQLGHFSNPATFVRHYKGVPVTAADAAAFWKIKPAKSGAQVVEFKAAG